MFKKFSRRIVSRAMLAAPGVLLPGEAVLGAQTDLANPIISSSHEVFGNAFGQPRLEPGFRVYDVTSDRPFPYWVQFNAGDIADYIVIDFSVMPGGGFEFSEDGLGKSRFLPEDAQSYGAQGDSGGLIDSSFYFVKWLKSDLVKANTGGVQDLIFIDEYANDPSGPMGSRIFLRSYITLGATVVRSAPAPVQLARIGDGMSIWESAYGHVSGTQNGWLIDNPPIAGSWLIDFGADGGSTARGINVWFDQPVPVAEATNIATGFMWFPEPTVSFWCPPTTDGGVGILCDAVITGNAGFNFALQFIRGGLESGVVERISVFSN